MSSSVGWPMIASKFVVAMAKMVAISLDDDMLL
jgi:hypothetical protein